MKGKIAVETKIILVILLFPFFMLSCGDDPVKMRDSDDSDEAIKTEPAAGSIKGQITPPIAGAVITVYRKEGQFVAFTEADERGNYLISALSPGVYSLEVAAPFHFLDVSNKSLEVVAGQTTEANRVFLRSEADAAIVSGKIIDAKTRKPLSSIRVKVECITKICAGFAVASNRDGIFETKLWPDLEANLIIQTDGYLRKEIKVKSLGVKGRLHVDLELEPK